jgi:hypothetical protein
VSATTTSGSSGGGGSGGSTGGAAGESGAGTDAAGTDAAEAALPDVGRKEVDPGAPDARDARSADAAEEGDGGTTIAFPCLPPGEEQLVIDVAGTPPLSVMNPAGVNCFSRYIAASANDEALLDLQWNGPDASLFVVVRNSNVVPGQTGTFTPFSILLATGAEAWTSLGATCKVTIASSSKIGETIGPGNVVREYYKVVGSMTCEMGWAAPDKPNAEMKDFRFATRATLTRTM